MKISIVIPTYNSEKFLRETIDSVIFQSYRNYELIVIDGGSKDNTLSIVESYQKRLSDKIKCVSERDKGEPDAINKGMKMATGDIIAYIDSDDIYKPECFSEVVKYFEKHNSMWLYGKCKIIDEFGNETRSIVTKFKELFQPHYSYETLLMFDYIAQPSVFWRKEILQTIGYMDIQEKLAFDYDYWLRIGEKYKAGYINEYISCWRSHKKSETAKALSDDLKQGLNLSLKYSPSQSWLRPFQYGIYFMALSGYKMMGGL